MSTGIPSQSTTAATRLGLLGLSLLSLTGAARIAVALEGPLRLLVALLGFAAYVLLFGRALEGLSLHNRKIHG